MHTYVFSAIAVFFSAHSYRDYLHMKGIKHTLFTRFAHFWDAPEYEKHGMIGSGILAVVFLVFAIS